MCFSIILAVPIIVSKHNGADMMNVRIMFKSSDFDGKDIVLYGRLKSEWEKLSFPPLQYAIIMHKSVHSS